MRPRDIKTPLVRIAILAAALNSWAVDPTFLRRSVPDLKERADDLTSAGSHYKPIFGTGDSAAAALKGMARYGELTVDPNGATAAVSYAAEEQIYYMLDGEVTLLYSGEKYPIRTNDFVYLPPGIQHGVTNSSSKPCRLLVMGFRIPAGTTAVSPSKLMKANSDDAKLVQLDFHGPTVLYKLLLGDTRTARNMLNVASVVTTLFIMEFAPGGTNVPHNHDRMEEIYYVLSGHGEMVAGGGIDGTEGRYPAKAGDAYFFRLNTTVGFYSGTKDGEEPAKILAVQSAYPFP
jgi:mannose-6-phosphate isomerase-like protein (cupin superfamily)